LKRFTFSRYLLAIAALAVSAEAIGTPEGALAQPAEEASNLFTYDLLDLNEDPEATISTEDPLLLLKVCLVVDNAMFLSASLARHNGNLARPPPPA
jgi:hypothetical protein